MELKRWNWGWVAILGLTVTSGCSMIPTAPPEVAEVPPQQEVDPQARLSLARLSERHGDASQAAELYQAILRDEPQNQTAHHRLAVIAAEEQKLDLANQHFDQAMACGSPTADLLNDRAYFYYLQQDLETAEKDARQAIALEPRNKVARNNLALILGEKGQFDESLVEFRRVVGEAEAQANLAYVRAMAGDLDGAEKNLHKALELDSTLRPAANALLELSDRRRGIVRDVAPTIMPARPQPGSPVNPAGPANGQQVAQAGQSTTAPANGVTATGITTPGTTRDHNPTTSGDVTTAHQWISASNAQPLAPWGTYAQPQTVAYQATVNPQAGASPQPAPNQGGQLPATPQGALAQPAASGLPFGR